ncbi:hypothetical protein GCM10010430_05150 [Kitasatospora cystarginea]|uniref:DUF397 domain-containing protein n=1 Tax=Kitasatospora cystarginea TaxID=58350 RepID=A0ABP5Q9D6_9ACTN
MIDRTDISFGPDSRNRLSETADPSAVGAEAALESFPPRRRPAAAVPAGRIRLIADRGRWRATVGRRTASFTVGRCSYAPAATAPRGPGIGPGTYNPFRNPIRSEP